MIKSDIRTLADGSLHVSIAGKIDEHFEGAAILAAAERVQKVVLKLDGVRSISSLGVRAFEALIDSLGARDLVLEDISAAVANQVTMIPNLLGRARVSSARLPFICPSCGAEQSHVVPYIAGATVSHAPACVACGSRMEFDGFSEEYLPSTAS